MPSELAFDAVHDPAPPSWLIAAPWRWEIHSTNGALFADGDGCCTATEAIETAKVWPAKKAGSPMAKLRTPHGYRVRNNGWGRLQQALRDRAWQMCFVGCQYGEHPDENPCDNCIAAACADIGWFSGQPVPARFASTRRCPE